MSVCLSNPGAAFFLRIPVWNCPGQIVQLHFDCAGSNKQCIAILGRGIFPLNSRVKRLLSHFHVQFDRAGLHKTVVPLLDDLARVSRFTLGGPGENEDLDRSLVEVLVKMKILMESCYRSLHDLVQYRSSWEDLVDIWLTSSKTSLHDLA